MIIVFDKFIYWILISSYEYQYRHKYIWHVLKIIHNGILLLFLSYCLGHSKWHSISTFCKGVCTRLTFNLFITVILIKSHHDDDSQFRICAHFSLLGVTQWEGFCEWFIIGINFSCRVWIAKSYYMRNKFPQVSRSCIGIHVHCTWLRNHLIFHT